MRYDLDGLTLRTENAAKPMKQARRFLVDYLAQLPTGTVALDYGCGKFRYTVPMAQVLQEVHAVDSHQQVARTQNVDGERTTLEAYAARHLPNVQVHCEDADSWKGRLYDFALCSDVLPVVPCRLWRVVILRSIASVLADNGQLLVCTRYSDSYFDGYSQRPDARQHLDGWLLSGSRPSFFGLITLPDLQQLCTDSGLNVLQAFVRDHSAYVVAGTGK